MEHIKASPLEDDDFFIPERRLLAAVLCKAIRDWFGSGVDGKPANRETLEHWFSDDDVFADDRRFSFAYCCQSISRESGDELKEGIRHMIHGDHKSPDAAGQELLSLLGSRFRVDRRAHRTGSY